MAVVDMAKVVLVASQGELVRPRPASGGAAALEVRRNRSWSGSPPAGRKADLT